MNWLRKIFKALADFCIPEQKGIENLLKVDPWVLKDLLPKQRREVKGTVILFSYQHKVVKTMVKAMKYKGHRELSKLFATYLLNEVEEMIAESTLFGGQPPIILPVPMSKEELASRGFSHSAEILRDVERLAPKIFEYHYTLLKKTKETKKQVRLYRTERLTNVKYSMRVDDTSTILKNRTVFVVDDILTTGATFAEARRALRAAGAKHVYGLFLAGP